MSDPPRAEDALPLPPAGWYPDPEAPEQGHRFWDGERWTDERRAFASHHVADPQDPPRRLSGLAGVAVAGLAIVAVLEVFNIAAGAQYMVLIEDALDGRQPDASEIDDADDRVAGAAVGLVGAYLLIGPITFLPWFFRAYRNLRRFGIPDLRYAPGWAIGSWFIPIFNLFRPKQIANDIDRGSAPGTIVNDGTWHERRPSMLLHWWWAMFLITGFLSNAGARVVAGADDEPILTQAQRDDALEEEQAGFAVDILSSVCGIAAIVLAIIVIRRISRNQESAITGLGPS